MYFGEKNGTELNFLFERVTNPRTYASAPNVFVAAKVVKKRSTYATTTTTTKYETVQNRIWPKLYRDRS